MSTVKHTFLNYIYTKRHSSDVCTLFSSQIYIWSVTCVYINGEDTDRKNVESHWLQRWGCHFYSRFVNGLHVSSPSSHQNLIYFQVKKNGLTFTGTSMLYIPVYNFLMSCFMCCRWFHGQHVCFERCSIQKVPRC